MYLAIEGVIGVGKTTLARLLQGTYSARLCLEVFEENPFLSDFYADRVRYAFQTQIFFLLSRYHQQRREVAEALRNGHAITDYTFAKDALFARLNLRGDELEMYYRVHEALAEKVPAPDLIVYLQASTEALMQRIALRDRPYERLMERAYIEELVQAYDSFFAGFAESQVLTIGTDGLNFVANPEHLGEVRRRINSALKIGPYQPELPL